MGGAVKGITDAVGITSSDDKKYMNQAAGLSREQIQMLKEIDLPDYEKMRLALELPELAGLLEAEQLGDSAMEDIRIDPRFREAQMRALAELEERGRVGLTPEDRARLSEITRETDAAEQARQKGILQSMAERGQLDSGAQLIAQLQSSAASSTDARRQGEQLAAQAAAARRQALDQAGNLAGDISQQQFGQQSQQASARDAIQQFNLGQRANIAQQNLAARQNIENQQTALRNQQQMYNKGLEQQRFQDELAKTGATGGAMQNLAGVYGQQAQNVSAGNQATIGGLATIGGAIFSDKNLKEDIKRPKEDQIMSKLEEMLDQLKAYKYNYKDGRGLPEGEKIGPMAQDLEKSELGRQFVENTPQGKMVDYGEMAGTQLAALAELHKRVKDLEGDR